MSGVYTFNTIISFTDVQLVKLEFIESQRVKKSFMIKTGWVFFSEEYGKEIETIISF